MKWNKSLSVSPVASKHFTITMKMLLGFLILTGCASKQVIVDFNSANPHEMTASNTIKFKYKEKFYLDRVLDIRKEGRSGK